MGTGVKTEATGPRLRIAAMGIAGEECGDAVRGKR